MKKILIQFDTDSLPSTFDRVVALDAGADEIFSYGGITPENVEPLVHGAIFTRSPSDLMHTAIFIGGSNVAAGEAVYERVKNTLFGPFSVSIMMDSNGSNTTAAATVLCAMHHLNLAETSVLVLAGTGPVGFRVAQLLLSQGARVSLASRSLDRSKAACDRLAKICDSAKVTPCESSTAAGLDAAAEGVQLIVAAGAAGAELISEDQWRSVTGLKLAIDLNAVAPAGIGSVEVMDKATERHGVVTYGAIGVGGTKMKIHHAAVRRLFESNDRRFDTTALFELGHHLLPR
ncbi:MAG: Bifunctional NADP-dependent methylenetetrahydromethanopterin [Schlesneria sp.]|nr:Bifunctional NADP-dependent methylenetetrahydromethanopterin [Schlesneria sp.]